MDENTLNQIGEFLSKWGFWQIVIIALTCTITLLVKIPIKRAAENYQERTGIDKSVITWCISLIPFVLAFVGALVLNLWALHWDVNLIDWPEVTKQTGVLGGAAIGTFEAIKKWSEAIKANTKKNAEAKAQVVEQATAVQEPAKVVSIVPEVKVEQAKAEIAPEEPKAVEKKLW